MRKNPSNKKFTKWFLVAGLLFLLSGAGIYLYFYSLKYEDTAAVKPDFTVEALSFIKSFEENSSEANKKYTEKIISVSGKISAIEPADTTLNIKFINPATGSYTIFAFQKQHVSQAKALKLQDSVSIKGSCSGGEFSEILGTVFITFKRCVLEKNINILKNKKRYNEKNKFPFRSYANRNSWFYPKENHNFSHYRF